MVRPKKPENGGGDSDGSAGAFMRDLLDQIMARTAKSAQSAQNIQIAQLNQQNANSKLAEPDRPRRRSRRGTKGVGANFNTFPRLRRYQHFYAYPTYPNAPITYTTYERTIPLNPIPPPYHQSAYSKHPQSSFEVQMTGQPTNMAYNNYNNQYAGNAAYGAASGYGAPPGYPAQYTQQQQQQQQAYQASPPQIANPFPRPPPATGHPGNANFDPDYEQQVAQWNAQYMPADQQPYGKKGGRNDRADQTVYGASAQRGAGAAAADGADGKGKSAEDSKFTVVRKGGGETWEDKSLLEWDPKQFRIMVGNLAGEVTDESLAKAFAAYGVSKARVVRDKRTTKSKGFGFVSFSDHDQGFKAAREMVGKYIGSHPVTIERSKTQIKPIVKKDQNKGKGKNNKNKNKDQGEKDLLRANTNAGVEKKTTNKPPPGLKLLG